MTACERLPELGLEAPVATPAIPDDTAVVEPADPAPDDDNTAVLPLSPPDTAVTQNRTSLIIWTIPALSPTENALGGQLMAEQIRAFEATYPNFSIQVELKEASGPGSINSYLSTARPIAPSILPDIILMPVEQMREAANSGLIQPVSELITAELQDDLYPAAQSLVTSNGDIWGFPYALRGLTHTAYNSDTFTATIPLQLNELTSTAAIMVLPAAGEEGSKLFLQYYLEAGGTVLNDSGQPTLDLEPLTAVLTVFKEARDLGLIHPQSYTLQTMDEAWQLYRTGSANIALTQPIIYTINREASGVTQFAPVPGGEDPLRPLLTGWAWSISTPDPAKQEIAAEFVNWMTNTENMGAWSEASNRLPARQSAFATWNSTPYVAFLQTQTERASAYPFAAHGLISATLSQNLAVLLSPTSGDPAQLAEQMVGAVQP